MEKLLKYLCQSKPFLNLVDKVSAKQSQTLTGVVGSADAFVSAQLFTSLDRSMLAVFANSQDAQPFYQDACELIGDDKVLLFPALERQFWNEIGPSHALIGRRLNTLKKMITLRSLLVVTTVEAMMEKIATPETMSDDILTFQQDMEYDFEKIIASLVDMGYVREDRVDQPGEMSVRGGLLDIYLLDEPNPVRIEFFGDQVESIRTFDVDSQRSIEKIPIIDVVPLSAAGIFEPLDELSASTPERKGCLFDYLLQSNLLLIQDLDWLEQNGLAYQNEINEKISQYNNRSRTQTLYYDDHFLSFDSVSKQLTQSTLIELAPLKPHFPVIDFPMQSVQPFQGDMKALRATLSTLPDEWGIRSRVVVACDSKAQTDRLRNILIDEEFPSFVAARHMDLSKGFSWPDAGIMLLTNAELFNRVRFSRLDTLETRTVSFKELAELKNGDFVVHSDYGIGLYRGLEHIEVYGRKRECIIIEYKDGDKLYVPTEKMDCVQKYTSKESAVPTLSKLGSVAWERLKSKTKTQIKEIAENLIKLYATRKTRKGYSFASDTVWQNELEASFQYNETPDQVVALEDIKKDMENDLPMDRLVCGDVGFGKTEVALRAAFKAVDGGKQVAVLVPTTVLAQQHYHTFKERLNSFPISVDVISRFRKAKTQKEIIQHIQSGKIDIIIGTHRLLSKDIAFKDLGLLIVDEEQKFGVLHKERLKLLKKTVDTLTLSATPIPRTMQMSLMGARDFSIINTPPANRLPIKSEVSRFDRELIRQAILREVSRNGQVFFVHNRVQSIYAIAGLLQDLVPEVTFAVAHGQMEADELEAIMLKFTNGEIQCLVSTMIIESGIDVANANTLIVNRADRFGLAQLYQLRGRVGRSNQQAFAYFLIPPIKKLNRTAIKRLQAIQEYHQLGSGYQIAMRDLEIRGAGHIFGAKQSGFVDALGYEMYTRIIHEAIDELRQELDMEKPKEQPELPDIETRLNIQVDAYLPEPYIPSGTERVEMYKKLAASKTLDEIEALEIELKDRYGRLPMEAENLLHIIAIKLLAKKNRISELLFKNGQLKGKFYAQGIPTGEQFREWIGTIVQKGGTEFQLKQEKDTLHFNFPLSPDNNSLLQTRDFLKMIA